MESLDWIRYDLLQTAATRRGAMVIFPSRSRKRQSIGIGDLSGTVQCLSVKNGQPKIAFKTLPSQRCITTVVLSQCQSQRGRLFIAEDAIIRGLTQKGKEFFRFDTQFSEPVNGICVWNSTLVVFGEFTCIYFEKNVEKSVYVSANVIIAFDGFVIDKELNLALACQDRRIRIVREASVLHQISMQSVPTSIISVWLSHDPYNIFPEAHEFLYGMEDGTMGQLFMDPNGLHFGFQLDNSQRKGSITALFSGIDFNNNGMTDIVVGRDDGFLEVYAMDESGTIQNIFETRLGDKINTLCGGNVLCPHTSNLLVQTYTGKIIIFASRYSELFVKAPTNNASSERETIEILDIRMDDLKSQIGIISKQIQQKK